MPSVDIASNRGARKYTSRELVLRVLWCLVQPLFRCSPRLCWGWRNWLLRRFGATIGRHVQIHPSARIFLPSNLKVGDWSSVGFEALLYNLGPLSIEDRVTISQRAHLCGGSHDFRDESMVLLRSPITIESQAWICADAFIGPGVTIFDRAIVGARAVVVKNVDSATIVAGNPARVVGKR